MLNEVQPTCPELPLTDITELNIYQFGKYKKMHGPKIARFCEFGD